MDKIFLNIGCGNCKLDGFINIDLESTADLQLDVRKGLPFDDNSVNGIYSEHFIEHLIQSEAVVFLRECRRILKYEGILRISTPDLSNCVQRYLNNDWREKTNIDSYGFGWLNTPCEYLNTAMREWGHKWIYDETELVRLAKYAGFYQFKRCESGKSKSLPLFNNLESRIGDFLIIEAQKRKIKKKSDNPLVSIFIPAYNYRYFSDALESALNQSYDNVEIIIGDDSHSEKIKDIVEILNKKYPARKIHYFREGAPGQGEKINFTTCLSKSKGELIKPLYDDDLLGPRCVERMVEYINKHPGVTLVASHRQLIDSEGRKLPDINGTKRIVQNDALINGSAIVKALVTNRINFIGEPSTVMFRKEDLIDEYPGIFSFAGRKPVMNGDVALWMKLLSRGDCIYIAETLSSFRRHKEQAQQQSGKREKGLLAWEHALFDANRMGFLSPFVPQLSGQPLSEKSLGAKKIFSVSIIIPVLNQLEYTKQCIEALIQNTPDELYEVIIVDNASTDGTEGYLSEVQSSKLKAERLKIVRNEKNLGFAKACNQGAIAAQGEYLVFLNNDTKVLPGWLDELVKCAQEDKKRAVVGAKLLYPDDTIQHAGVAITDAPHPIFPYHVHHKEPSSIPEVNVMKEYQAVTGACMLVRQDLFRKLGGFDEKYVNGYEDVDLCFRVREHGYKILYCPKSVVYHYESTTEGRFDSVEQNIKRLHRKWLGKIHPDQDSDNQKEIKKLASIVILAHNQLEYTKKCIESIFKYTKNRFELIVVDNGSTDGTVHYLENLKFRYGANCTDQQIEASKPKGRKKEKGKKKKAKKLIALDKSCTDIKVIRNKENLGFAAGNNQGMAAAKGNYILLMNNDVVVTPGWLERMISCAERNPKIGIVGPMSNYVIGPQLVKEVSYNSASLARLNKYAKKFAENNADQAKLILRVVGFCMLIKRAVIDKIGGMDDRYGLGNFEDDDFSLRATLAGFESWIAKSCFVHHFGSRTFIGAKIDYNESLRKNWEIFKKKWKLPRELSCGSPYTISHIPKDGFDPAKHYCPLSKNDILPKQTGIISESPGEIYGRIQPILASGQHEKAIITLEKLLESYPDFALAHNDLGILYFNKLEKEKALNHYEKAAQLEPNNITFHKNLSDFYYVELGRLEEALQGYVHVLSINPKDVETLLIVGHICVALHKFDDAQVFYSKVLEIEPENVDARQNLDKLDSSQSPVVSGQPEQDSVALKPVSFLMNQENDKKNENMEPQQEASNKNIRASIIIPALNQQKLIKKCVKNIQEYTSEPYEIIFVNKGAKSSTLKWLRGLVKENVNYQLVELEKGANYARCYNKGIEASSGGYIVLLHSDVVVTEGWISGMLECINSVPDAGIVGPMTNNASGVQKVSDSDDISLDHLEEFAKSFRQRNRYCRVPTRELSEFCLLCRRELVEKIGPFDESLGQSNLEVDDICLRAALEGYRNNIAGDVFVYKYNGPKLIGNKKNFTEKWNSIDAQSPLGKKLLTLNAIEKAVVLDEKGQIDDAVKILAQGVGHVHDAKRLYHTLSEMLINNKQYKEALDALNELPPDDQDIKNLELTGYCMEGMEQYKEAEEYADHALSLDAASALALNLKGILAYRQGDNSMAEDFFNRAIASDPGFGEPYTNLGALKWAMGDQEEALDLYERGFILSPTIMDIVTIYHSAVTDVGAFERAAPVFRDAITLHPQNRRLKYLSIDILIKQGKHDLAIEDIEGAMIAFGMDDGLLSAALKVREALGPVEIDEKSNKKGIISLCMIVKSEEQHLAKCLKSLKPVVDEMIVVDTGSTDMTRDIAKVFGARVYDFEWRDDFSEARNYSISKASGDWIIVMDADEVISSLDYVALRKLVKKSTSRSVAYSFVTRNYSTRANTIGWTVNDGKYGTEEAGSGWMPSIKVRLFPNVSHIRFEYPVHEKVEPALKRSGIEIKKCNIPVHHYGQLNEKKFDLKGEAYYDMGRKKLEELGDDVVAIRELAVQAGGLEKHDEAIGLWQRLVAIKPDMPVAYVNMGTAYLKLGKYEDALLSARKAVELAPNMKEALNNYALCQLYLGNARQAIPALEKLMEQEPEYLSAQFVLAAAYCCDGKMKRGLEAFEKLSQTITRPGLAVACHDLAKKLVSAQRLEYAISLLEAAIEGKYVNKDVLSLLSECKRTEQASVNHIDSASVCPIQFGDTQLHSNSAPLR